MSDEVPDITQPDQSQGVAAPAVRRSLLPERPVEVTISEARSDSTAESNVDHSPEAAAVDPTSESTISPDMPDDQPPKSRWAWTQDPVVRQTTSILTVGGLIAAIVAIVVSFAPMSVRAGEIRALPLRVQIEWPPLAGEVTAAPDKSGTPKTWVNQETRETLETLVHRTMSESPVDGEALARTRQALIRTGWFTDALRVERSADGLVRVGPALGTSTSALWRFPVAAIRCAGKDHLVASGGELLPLSYTPDASGMKLIVGVRATPPAWGETWVGGDVQAALKLLSVLQASPLFRPGTSGYRQLAAIDVSQFTPDKQLTIITERGTKVIWGGPLETMNPGQVRDSVKLERLAALLRDYGRLDAGQALIDIRVEGNIYVVDQNARPAPEPEHKPGKPNTPGKRGGRASTDRAEAGTERR